MFSNGQRLAIDTAHLGAVADDMWIQGLKDSKINKDQSRTMGFNANIVDSRKRRERWATPTRSISTSITSESTGMIIHSTSRIANKMSRIMTNSSKTINKTSSSFPASVVSQSTQPPACISSTAKFERQK